LFTVFFSQGFNFKGSVGLLCLPFPALGLHTAIISRKFKLYASLQRTNAPKACYSFLLSLMAEAMTKVRVAGNRSDMPAAATSQTSPDNK
jgi:hypothetical protein